jgi:hypothetical protein
MHIFRLATPRVLLASGGREPRWSALGWKMSCTVINAIRGGRVQAMTNLSATGVLQGITI